MREGLRQGKFRKIRNFIPYQQDYKSEQTVKSAHTKRVKKRKLQRLSTKKERKNGFVQKSPDSYPTKERIYGFTTKEIQEFFSYMC